MSLNPQTTSSSSGNYLFHNLYRGLFIYTAKHGLKTEGAEKCLRQNRQLICHLKASHRWSTGERITADDYLRSFQNLIDPKNKSHQSDVLFTIQNAREIWNGKLEPLKLGVRAQGKFTLVFNFAQDDFEFEYRLIHPALTPTPEAGYPERLSAATMKTSGPYKILEWKPGGFVKLASNTFYPENTPRPLVEAYFIDDDSTALRMYESGKLNFLRRVTGSEVKRFKSSQEFYQISMARFDYIGFGPDLNDKPEIRRALIEGVQHTRFLDLFDTRTPPGCPSLPRAYFGKFECVKYDELAREKLPESKPKLQFNFSRMGGDDIARIAEWFQGQWKKNLGLEVELEGVEQGVYLRNLRVKAPAIFRKGVSLDRPTCLAALEVFTKGNPENYLQFESMELEKIAKLLSRTSNPKLKANLCRDGLALLTKSQRIMFMGEMMFSILARPQFQGWDLNELNQLELSQLRYVPNSP